MSSLDNYLDSLDISEGEDSILELIKEKKSEKGKNLWDVKDFEPVDLKPSDVDNKNAIIKTFTILTYPELIKLKEPQIKSLCNCIGYLTSHGYKYRHSLVDTREPENGNALLRAANGNVSGVYTVSKKNVPEGFEFGCKHTEKTLGVGAFIHPKFSALPSSIRFTWSAIVQSLLGKELNQAVDLLVIYTICGNTHYDYKDEKLRDTFGFIGSQVKYAVDMGIPVFNIKGSNANEQIKEFVATHKAQPKVTEEDF